MGFYTIVYDYDKTQIPRLRKIEELIGGILLCDKTCLECETCKQRKEVMPEEQLIEMIRRKNKEQSKE